MYDTVVAVIPRFTPRWRALAAAAVLLAIPAASRATEHACGPDPIANTADILCAAPSGPCDATTVHVTAGIEAVLGGGPCDFDLEGRALVAEATIQTPDDLRFLNVGDLTITPSGKLKARGDFLAPAGILEDGGRIQVYSAGVVHQGGLIDVSGAQAGEIRVEAAGDIVVELDSETLANGLGPLEDGERFGSGGYMELLSLGGSIQVSGPLAVRGQSAGDGGLMVLTASREITVDATLDATGGYGGIISVEAGDRIGMHRAVDAQSTGSGGDGGIVDIFAFDGIGAPVLQPDVLPGTIVEMSGATFDLRGSATDGVGGVGGDFMAASDGPLLIAADVTINVDGGAGPGGDPGSTDMETDRDGDLIMEGTISAHGGSDEAAGSFFGLSFWAARNLVISGKAETSGRLGGGEIIAQAGGQMILTGTLRAQATGPSGEGGFIELGNGFTADASMIIDTDLNASGGPLGLPGYILVNACTLDVRPSRTLNHRAGFENTNVPIIDLGSLHPMQLGANSSYLTGPVGQIHLRHPPGADPVIGDGAIFEGTTIDIPETGPYFPECPPAVCGNGVREHGEQCDDGNGDDGDGCAADCTVRCLAMPAPDCHQGEATLVLKDDPGYERDTLAWKWRGAATSLAEFGSPFTEDDYMLCFYDETAEPEVMLKASIPAGSICGSKPCWRYQGRQGVMYRSRDNAPDGVAKLQLKAGANGKARVGAKGKGQNLSLPFGPLPLPARVQLQTEHGACWEAGYTSAEQNAGGRFKATSTAP